MLALAAHASGCSSLSGDAPHGAPLDALAARHGAQRELVHDGEFEHVVYARGASSNATRMNVYFEGDGRPWRGRYIVAADPTSRVGLGLELMLSDSTTSYYVARPCYHGRGPSPPCGPLLWTVDRYSDAVVESMRRVVERLIARHPHAEVTLVGYSGGGVLALLVGERIDRIGTVVTIAANLDVAGWSQFHGYSPLTGSLDPAQVPRWRRSLRQIHYAGERDRNVPLEQIRAFAARVPTAELRTIAEFDHRCCWVDAWPRLLRTLDGG